MLLEVSYGRLAASKVTLSVTWVSGFGGHSFGLRVYVRLRVYRVYLRFSTRVTLFLLGGQDLGSGGVRRA